MLACHHPPAALTSRGTHASLRYAAGGTLEDTIKFQADRGPFPVDFVTAWLSQLCDAVQYMHDSRVLHRDISSGNVFLSYGGDILLGDLGLSRQLSNDTVGVTKVATQVGTPPYMSPEIVTGQDYGTSSDVWAVGVVLFEMLALTRPFTGGNFMQIATAIGKGEPTAEAKMALDSSGHPPDLIELAGQRGLLNPNRAERTPLTTVIEMYPQAKDGEEEAAAEAAADSRVEKLHAGPLRPASQRGPTKLDALLEGAGSDPRGSQPGSVLSMASSYTPSTSSSYPGGSTIGGSSQVSSYAGSMASSYMESITSTALSSASAFSSRATAIPQECPVLPPAFQPRPDLAERLMPRILADGPHVGLAGATVAFGMGGTGKSTLVGSLVRHPAVSGAYQRLCWLPLGQTPDLRRLLALTLHQLTKGESSANKSDEQLGDILALQQKVVTATKGLSVLCVLDDVWDPAHARALGEPLEGAVIVVTTRLHHLLPGAHHVHCGLLSQDESLQLLLRAGDVDLPPNGQVPQAAKEVVELCGRLPLTLALAGAMLQEHADDWERKLVPLLRGDNRSELRRRSLNDDDDDDDEEEEETTEGRVITSSLSLLRSKKHHMSVVLFMMCAAFPEDATVAAAVFDALEEPFSKMVRADAKKRSKKDKDGDEKKKEEGSFKKTIRPRKCLKVLLEHSLLQGSIRDGIQMHDLLRVYVLARLSPSELEDLHCGILKALQADLTANSDSPSRSNEVQAYARAHFEHHAAGACTMTPPRKGGPTLAEDHPVLLFATDEQSADWVSLAMARGAGLVRLSAAAGAAAAAGQWLRSGRLWLASLGLGGEQEGERRWDAWCALKQVDPVTLASVELEAKVARGLVLKKGMKINSAEHTMLNARLDELIKTEVGAACAELKSARDSSKATQYFAILCKASGMADANGLVSTYYAFMDLGGSSTAMKLGASQGAARSCGALQQASSHCTILHADAAYEWEKDYGPGGSWLRDLVTWYDFSESKVQKFKSANGRDTMLCGLGSALLLVRWGPGSAPTGAKPWSQCTESWAEIASNVHLGKISWRNHRIDLVDMRATRAIAFAAGRRDDARRLFESSPEGSYFISAFNEGSFINKEHHVTVTEALNAHVQSLEQYMKHWQMACSWSENSFQLMSRALGTLLLRLPEEEAAGESADAAPVSAKVSGEWLPSPAALLTLASSELAWDVFMSGVQHPSLACACVAARLGRWAEAKEVAQGLLDMPLRQQLSRYEAHRLLARCAAATESSSEVVHKHLRAAAAEARGAGYLWLELLTTRELRERGGCDSATVDQLAARIESLQTATPAPEPAAAQRPSRRVQWSNFNEMMRAPTRPKKAGDPQWKSTPGPLGGGSASRIPATVPEDPDTAGPSGVSSSGLREIPPSKSGGKGPEVPSTPHLGGVGILNDAQIARARALSAQGDATSGFVKSKRSVKSLNLPLQ